MLIGQGVNKDSSISLRNEPLHRWSAASEEEEAEWEVAQRETALNVPVLWSSVVSFQLTKYCVDVCMWMQMHLALSLLSDYRLSPVRLRCMWDFYLFFCCCCCCIRGRLKLQGFQSAMWHVYPFLNPTWDMSSHRDSWNCWNRSWILSPVYSKKYIFWNCESAPLGENPGSIPNLLPLIN